MHLSGDGNIDGEADCKEQSPPFYTPQIGYNGYQHGEEESEYQ